MHAFTCLHRGGHLYRPDRSGEDEFDPATLLCSEEIVETRDLPGFVEGGVTYESHHFWAHFCRYPHRNPHMPPPKEGRFSSALVRVHHGGGWEVWRGDYMLAKALHRYGDDDRGLFLMCWFLIDAAREAQRTGYQEAKQEHRLAFVEGRLKKRKMPGRADHKVWIEEPKAPAKAA